MKPETPVYVIKPKYIFKTPFLKYDMQNPTNREAQNEELTEYFNYGFNEDTMNIYVKLVNRMLKVLDHKKNLEYFDEPSQLMRLNDQIPMDLGGFGKFYDPELFKNDFIQNDQQLLKIFLFNIVSASCFTGTKQYPSYPMLEFVKSMYPPKKTQQDQEVKQENSQPNPLTEMVLQITRNLQRKYEETMKKLIEQRNQPKQIYPPGPPFKKGSKFERRPYNEGKNQERTKKQEKQEKRQDKRQDKKRQDKRSINKKKNKRGRSSSSSSETSSSGTSSNSSSSSSSESEDERKKRHKDRRQRDSRKESKKERRSKSKEKRERKESRKQSRHISRHERRDSRNEERNRDRKRSQHRRSRSRDQKSHRR